VTNYVREEMDRADRFTDGDEKRKQNGGFALQILQRRLASSPAAIHESLRSFRLDDERVALGSAKQGGEGRGMRAWLEAERAQPSLPSRGGFLGMGTPPPPYHLVTY
jgi:hypothetical protein